MFERSNALTLEILNVVAEGSERGICTVYRCRIISIDGVPTTIPPLCLKLFDDRFQQMETPDEDEDLTDEFLPRWFDQVVCAERDALNEAFAHEKLLPLQGSLVPWFYGIHQMMC